MRATFQPADGAKLGDDVFCDKAAMRSVFSKYVLCVNTHMETNTAGYTAFFSSAAARHYVHMPITSSSLRQQ